MLMLQSRQDEPGTNGNSLQGPRTVAPSPTRQSCSLNWTPAHCWLCRLLSEQHGASDLTSLHLSFPSVKQGWFPRLVLFRIRNTMHWAFHAQLAFYKWQAGWFIIFILRRLWNCGKWGVLPLIWKAGRDHELTNARMSSLFPFFHIWAQEKFGFYLQALSGLRMRASANLPQIAARLWPKGRLAKSKDNFALI